MLVIMIPDLQGWFHPEEGEWYQNQVNKMKNGWIVEVGCWKGLSTSYLAPVLSGKPQRLWCVDNWKGSKDKWDSAYRELLIQHEKQGKPVPVQFRENLKLLKIPFKMLEMESCEAAPYFQDESCAFVFIDASHDFQSVSEDLSAWWPKVLCAGILAGHNYSHDFPELIKAVNEFSKKIEIPFKRGPKTVFYFKKPLKR